MWAIDGVEGRVWCSRLVRDRLWYISEWRRFVGSVESDIPVFSLHGALSSCSSCSFDASSLVSRSLQFRRSSWAPVCSVSLSRPIHRDVAVLAELRVGSLRRFCIVPSSKRGATICTGLDFSSKNSGTRSVGEMIYGRGGLLPAA